MADPQEKEATAPKAATEKTASTPQPAKAVPVKATPSVTFVYVGPARPFGVPLMQNAILRGEPEAVMPSLAAPLQAHPALRRLFVPVGGLAQARQELAKAGSGLAIIYRDIQTASAKARTA